MQNKITDVLQKGLFSLYVYLSLFVSLIQPWYQERSTGRDPVLRLMNFIEKKSLIYSLFSLFYIPNFNYFRSRSKTPSRETERTLSSLEPAAGPVSQIHIQINVPLDNETISKPTSQQTSGNSSEESKSISSESATVANRSLFTSIENDRQLDEKYAKDSMRSIKKVKPFDFV